MTYRSASPGYYEVALDNGVNVELTATTRTGTAQITLPAGSATKAVPRIDRTTTRTSRSAL